MVLVPGFLEMLLQLLFRVPAALANGTHLLGGGCRMGVLVRPVIRKKLAHSGIVPLVSPRGYHLGACGPRGGISGRCPPRSTLPFWVNPASGSERKGPDDAALSFQVQL